jgi:hypothetical protein
MYNILNDTLDGECIADLHRMLKMSIGILQGLLTEWVMLHHIDEYRFKLEVVISDIHLRPSHDIGGTRHYSMERSSALM